MVFRSYYLFNLILLSCSLEYGEIKYLKDSKGFLGINQQWKFGCRSVWSFSTPATVKKVGLITCFPKQSEEINCTALSGLYNVNEIKELYVNIQTETRDCLDLKIKNFTNCTGKFSLSVHYQINRNDFKRVVLPDEIPRKSAAKNFYVTNDNLSFSVEQKYKSFKLGFQAPFYCGNINSVSLYYYLCPAQTNALVDFSKVFAPSKITSPYVSVGTCTKNAVKKGSSHRLYMKCYYNGTAEVFGGCECEAGYTKNKGKCVG